MNAYTYPTPEEICGFLRWMKTIAVVGLSPEPERPYYQIASGKQRLGIRIIPVRPAVEVTFGERTYADLAALSEELGLVDVFRATHIDGSRTNASRSDFRKFGSRRGIVNVSAPPPERTQPVYAWQSLAHSSTSVS